MKILTAVSVLLVLLGLASPAFGQAARFAVVIGYGNCDELGKLKNPVNDA
jgi:hypothetical protein